MGEEKDYADSSSASPTSPLFAALKANYILSDDYYASRKPVEYLGQSLYIPEMAVGRLVETPAEIRGVIDGYVANHGVAATTAMVTGYDFLQDLGQAVSQDLKADDLAVDDNLTQSGSWTAADLQARLARRPDLAEIGAHFFHFAAIAPDQSLLTGEQVANLGGLRGSVIFTIGCHSGLNVPDVDSGASTRTLDMAQAFARAGATYLANTANGYGDTAEIGLGELLLRDVADELANAGPQGIAVGTAVMRAKQRFVHGAGPGGFGMFEQKSMLSMTLYGIPTYHVTATPATQALAAAAAPSGERGLAAVTDPPQPVAGVEGLAVRTYALAPQLARIDRPDGTSYYAAGGANGKQLSIGRPATPRVSVDVSAAGSSAHGALLLSAAYRTEQGFTPYVGSPAFDLARKDSTYRAPNWSPPALATINRLPLQDGAAEQLVALAMQFQSPTGARQGIARVYTALSYAVYYANAENRLPPTVRGVSATYDTAFSAARFNIQVQGTPREADPEAGILGLPAPNVARVLVTYTDGLGTWQSLDLTKDSQGNWTGSVPATRALTYFVQAVDSAGNVGQADNRGLFYAVGP
jgi:hypothetical protein